MRIRLILPLAACMLALCAPARAQSPDATALVVIAHPASGVEQLSRSQAINIFMGRYRQLPSGAVAFPVDIGDSSQERRQFYQALVGKDLAEVNAYWARLVFSGQTSPPARVRDARAALELVARNRAAIAYVERRLVDSRVRVVMDVAPPAH